MASKETVSQPTSGIAEDPRDRVTADAFHVKESMLGTPLASPARRLTAHLLDAAFITFLANLGTSVFMTGLGAFCLHRAWRRLQKRTTPRLGAIFIGTMGTLFLYLGIMGGVDQMGNSIQTVGMDGSKETEVVEWSQLAVVSDLLQAESSSGAREPARALVQDLRDAQLSRAEQEKTFNALLDALPLPEVSRIELEQAWKVAEGQLPAANPADFRDYASALETEDTVRMEDLKPKLVDTLIGAEWASNQHKRAVLQDKVEKLEMEMEKSFWKNLSLVQLLRHTADDLGLSLGWSALYFTFFTARWRGCTPAKRLLGMRVKRLDGAAITYWNAFERWGGYAAGYATGLLAFLPVFWDPNRQSIHDKIASTVVIRETVPEPTSGAKAETSSS